MYFDCLQLEKRWERKWQLGNNILTLITYRDFLSFGNKF